ncbi:MAG: hypothetical protein ABIG30_02555, partial [Candidatus Aenigmatarchaeota archaeon]
MTRAVELGLISLTAVVLLFVLLNPVLIMESVFGSRLTNDTQDSVVILQPSVFEKTMANYHTQNSRLLKVYYVTNPSNQTVQEQVVIEEKNVVRNVTLLANETWTYAIVDDYLIVPETMMLIGPRTSYYPSENQLRIELDTENPGTISVYANAIPSRVYSNATSINWGYKDGIVYVHSSFGSKYIIVIDWTNYASDSRITFAEDTTMIEDSAASIENMNTKAAEFAARARELVAGRDDVEKNGTEALN